MQTTVLVAGTKTKHGVATEAKNLYASVLFTKSRLFVERHGYRWFILSGAYGLLWPDQIVAPYDNTILTQNISERREWACRVWNDLKPYLTPGDPKCARIVFLAGASYREFLGPLLEERGFIVEAPMAGLGIGRQLQWLDDNT